ncbi:MAG: MFS transporter [Spirochaetia bacterium]|nr:MFS transporter [Spirochaetia bacterium]
MDSSLFIINKFNDNKENLEKEKISKTEWNKIFLLLFLAVMSIFFWVPYEQMGTSVNLFTERNVDRTLFGFNIPTSTFQSINGFLILILAPIFAFIWEKLSKKKLEPSVPFKFSIGFMFLGFSYLILLINKDNSKTGIFLLFGYYLLLTMGELCVSPVGLSTVSRLAPNRFASSLMGVWFMSNAISHYISGWFSGAYSTWMNIQELFLFLGIICMLSSFFLFSILPILKKYFPEN